MHAARHAHRNKARALLSRAGYADGGTARYVAVDSEPEGMVEYGNIDLHRTPGMHGTPGIRVDPEETDGGVSSVLSSSFRDHDGREVLVPNVNHKGFIEDPEAEYRRSGKHLGKFRSTPTKKGADLADQYAETLHLQQEGAMQEKKRGGSVRRLGRRHWRKARGQ